LIYIYIMMKVRYILLFMLLAAATALSGQYTKEFKRIFFDADYLFETEFYEEAFSRYKNLLTLDPGNSNILFHCGVCCLHILGSEDQAITYLKEAVEGVSPSYKDKSHKESGAPVFTYFLLGQAYHLDYQFSNAEESYSKYLELGSDQGQLQLEYARVQIEACKRASKIVRTRPGFEFQSVLEHFDKDLPSCSNPVISGDGNILIFLVDYPSDKKIMMTSRSDSLWSRPRVINSEIGMVGETSPVSLSYDGLDLYLAHQYYSHSDIFVSHFEGNRWTEAEPLGYKINGRTSENHASISRDGESLYFTTDVRGGYGSYDIYVSRLEEKGEWGEALNLGPTINTPFEERTPFISGNDSILFFSSQGHTTIGGLDVFYSKLNIDGSWSEPENLGYPVNTTSDDLFFNPGWDELEGYYAVRRPDDPTSNTITMVMELEYEEELAQAAPVDSVIADQTLTMVAPVVVVAEPVVSMEKVIEPPNTDEVENVLNERSDPEPKPKPLTVPVVTNDASPAFTNELTSSVPFDFNEYELSMAAMLETEKIADLMNEYPDVTISLTGHADATGTAEYNMLLSMHRADNIANYLEMRGVNRGRIRVDGVGESAPKAKNTFEDGSDAPLGRYLNRQVYVKITGRLPVESGLAGVYIPANLKSGGDQSGEVQEYFYSIQLSAIRKSISVSMFEDLDNVTEYPCKDGFYRYTTGSYRTFQEARDHLKEVQKKGYDDAFIQTCEWYEKAMK
jgi:outer membrane protein OmpA-like peptidoglycan-associated protein/tetratricopeptide (TPR) repeat protein